jgi:hypothetical protein
VLEHSANRFYICDLAVRLLLVGDRKLWGSMIRIFSFPIFITLAIGFLPTISLAENEIEQSLDIVAVTNERVRVDRIIGYYDYDTASGYQVLLMEEGLSEGDAKIDEETFYAVAKFFMELMPESSDFEANLQQGDMTAFMLYVLVHQGMNNIRSISEDIAGMDRSSPAFYEKVNSVLPDGISDAFLVRRSSLLFNVTPSTTPQSVPSQNDDVEEGSDVVGELLQLLRTGE